VIVEGSTTQRDELAPGTAMTIDLDESGLPATVETWISLKFAWSSQNFDLEIAESDRVFDLKAKIQKLTNVPTDRQKIVGLVKGRLPPDEARIGDLQLIALKRFMLVGTPAGQELRDPDALEDLPEVFNDFDIDLASNPEAAQAYLRDMRNIRKIKEVTRATNITIMNPLREGKRLLVLDLDYTLVDTKVLTTGALPPIECARPGLHTFLEAVYPWYDVCVWSQTNWIWLETKLVELGMVGNSERQYKISFVLPKDAMFSVYSMREGKPYKHAVKPLAVIWAHFPQFNAKNTIHIDDLSRNFALNPGEGLKISAFRVTQNSPDRELTSLAQYLRFLADVSDFTSVQHKDWKKVVSVLQSIPPAVRRREQPPADDS